MTYEEIKQRFYEVVDMNEYKDNYIERKIEEYSQDKLIEAGIVLLEMKERLKLLKVYVFSFVV